MKLTSRSLYYGLLASVALLVAGLIGGTYLANATLNGQAKRLMDARTKSQALDVQQQRLARTKADIEKYQGLAAIAKGVVPQDKDQANTVREIVRIAGLNGIKLGAITFPSSTLGAGVTTPSGAASGTPSAAASAKPALSQLKAVPGLSGVYSMPITVQSDSANPVAYNKFISFLAGLEKNRRTALVSAITLQPSANNSSAVSFTLVIDEYIKP